MNTAVIYTNVTTLVRCISQVDGIIQDLVSIRPPRGLACGDFRVLLVGPRGSCKSSVINTLTSALAGRLKQPVLTEEATGGVTKQVPNGGKQTISKHLTLLFKKKTSAL